MSGCGYNSPSEPPRQHVWNGPSFGHSNGDVRIRADIFRYALSGDDTWIGAAVHFSLREMASNDFSALRKVIDLSGDGGVERIGLTQKARNAAVASGVVVNGLAIENEVLDLHVFFRDNLIGGAGAFVMRARSYADFAEVMRLKLIREIGERPMAERVPRQLPSLGLTSGRVFGLSALK